MISFMHILLSTLQLISCSGFTLPLNTDLRLIFSSYPNTQIFSSSGEAVASARGFNDSSLLGPVKLLKSGSKMMLKFEDGFLCGDQSSLIQISEDCSKREWEMKTKRFGYNLMCDKKCLGINSSGDRMQLQRCTDSDSQLLTFTPAKKGCKEAAKSEEAGSEAVELKSSEKEHFPEIHIHSGGSPLSITKSNNETPKVQETEQTADKQSVVSPVNGESNMFVIHSSNENTEKGKTQQPKMEKTVYRDNWKF